MKALSAGFLARERPKDDGQVTSPQVSFLGDELPAVIHPDALGHP
jgi:hypothetical protein